MYRRYGLVRTALLSFDFAFLLLELTSFLIRIHMGVGGGLYRVNGKPRLVEGLALPREEDELKSSYYNSLTTWIDIDGLLNQFGLDRDDLSNADSDKIQSAVLEFSKQLPSYVTIKDVKMRWGNGQEDVHPVAQFEKVRREMAFVLPSQLSYRLTAT